MNCKVLFIVLVNLIHILFVCSSPYLHHLMTKRTRLCGSHLTRTLSLVCQGRYPTYDKKSFGDDLSDNDYEGDYHDLVVGDNDIDFPFLSKEAAKNLIPQKMRRGVFNECCQKSCSMKELSYYCAA